MRTTDKKPANAHPCFTNIFSGDKSSSELFYIELLLIHPHTRARKPTPTHRRSNSPPGYGGLCPGGGSIGPWRSRGLWNRWVRQDAKGAGLFERTAFSKRWSESAVRCQFSEEAIRRKQNLLAIQNKYVRREWWKVERKKSAWPYSS